jgi:hypothetical protein
VKKSSKGRKGVPTAHAGLKLRSVGIKGVVREKEFDLEYVWTPNPNTEGFKPVEEKVEIPSIAKIEFNLQEITSLKHETTSGFNFNYDQMESSNPQFTFTENLFVREYEMFSSNFSKMFKLKRSLPLMPDARFTSPPIYTVAQTFSKLTSKDEFMLLMNGEIVSRFKT